jgi:hypothetical protein
MKHFLILFLAAMLSSSVSYESFAKAVAQHTPIPEDASFSPQIEWDGTGVGTLKGLTGSSLTPSPTGTLDFTDSALIFSASQALYQESVGSFVFGSLLTDSSQSGAGNPIFIHQAYVAYQAKWFEAMVGRSDNPMAQFVDFSTIRADDLITFTSYLDPFSDGSVVENHRYSNVGSFTLNQDLKTFENIHVQHLIHSSPGSNESRIDSIGVTFEQLNSLPELEALSRVVMWGFGGEHVFPGGALGDAQHVLYAGGAINLNTSVTNRIELKVQDILTFGSSISSFKKLSDTFAADSNALAMSLRYLNSPFGTPGYQVSLTAGMRTYQSISDAISFGAALTGVKRLGMGFDLVAQYAYQWRATSLANQYGGALDHRLEVGLAYNFESTSNRHINPRRSLLNMQHQYIPQ